MAATYQEIAEWFDRGVQDGHSYMLVVCDTFDHTDFPVYAQTATEVLQRKSAPGVMERVMEIYDLHADKATQMAQDRCWAL